MLRTLWNWATKSTSGKPSEETLAALNGGSRLVAGQVVTPETAIQLAAVYACVRKLAESLSTLPLVVYQRLPGEGRRRVGRHPVQRLLNQPCGRQNGQLWREYGQTCLGLRGNTFSRIHFDEAGRIVRMAPLHPDRVKVRTSRDDDQLFYEVQPKEGGKGEIVPDWQMLHVRALSLDGYVGLSPIGAARKAIGLGLAAQDYGSRYFENDARPAVVIRHPEQLSEVAANRIKNSFQKRFGGGNLGGVAVLEEGMEVDTIGVAPQDAQYLETRKFQVAEIARIYGVPLHMIGDLERATFSNIEHQDLGYLRHTLLAWLVRWEAELNAKLLTESQRERYFIEFLVEGLLRGDTASRYAAYNTGRMGGWLSANEIRAKENMPPIPGGDTYLQPLNMAEAGDELDDEEPAEDPPADDDDTESEEEPE